MKGGKEVKALGIKEGGEKVAVVTRIITRFKSESAVMLDKYHTIKKHPTPEPSKDYFKVLPCVWIYTDIHIREGETSSQHRRDEGIIKTFSPIQ